MRFQSILYCIVWLLDPPVVDVNPSFLLLTSGESTWLKCSFGNGFPVPRILWDKNEVRIAGTRCLKKTRVNFVLECRSSENVTVLELAKVSPKDTGSYKCTASTDLGDTHATASVVVREKYRSPEIYYKSNWVHNFCIHCQKETLMFQAKMKNLIPLLRLVVQE